MSAAIRLSGVKFHADPDCDKPILRHECPILTRMTDDDLIEALQQVWGASREEFDELARLFYEAFMVERSDSEAPAPAHHAGLSGSNTIGFSTTPYPAAASGAAPTISDEELD